MTSRKLRLPEPTLPEHSLIRDSMPMPELSSGFKSRVMVECAVNVAKARRATRWKVAGVLTAACCLCFLVLLTVPETPETSPHVTTSQQPVSSESPGYSLGASPGSSGLSAHQPKVVPGSGSDRTQVDEVIDTLKGRQQMLDANLLPRF